LIDTTCEPGSVCRYRIDVKDEDGTRTILVTGKLKAEAPELALDQNFPNPFNPSTTISFSLPKTSHLVLDVYDAQGCRIKRLVDSVKESGRHSVQWNGHNDNEGFVSSGVYFYKLTAGKKSITKKMILMR